jgi:hypothetical protein
MGTLRPCSGPPRISEAQAILVIAMVFTTTTMARGLGFSRRRPQALIPSSAPRPGDTRFAIRPPSSSQAGAPAVPACLARRSLDNWEGNAYDTYRVDLGHPSLASRCR